MKQDQEISELQIEKASNGFTVYKHLRPSKKQTRPSSSVGYIEPEKAVFSNLAEMLEYVRECFVGPEKKRGV